MDVTHITMNIATVVSIVLALLIATRSFTAQATRLQVSQEATDKRMNAATAVLEQVPLLIQAIKHLETIQSEMHRKVFSEFPKMQVAISRLEEKAASTDRFKAVRMGSSPDLEKGK